MNNETNLPDHLQGRASSCGSHQFLQSLSSLERPWTVLMSPSTPLSQPRTCCRWPTDGSSSSDFYFLCGHSRMQFHRYYCLWPCWGTSSPINPFDWSLRFSRLSAHFGSSMPQVDLIWGNLESWGVSYCFGSSGPEMERLNERAAG